MSVYFDPTHDEWVGDHATYDGEFVSRQTEWFATKEQAQHFSRTGESAMPYLADVSSTECLDAGLTCSIDPLTSRCTECDQTVH